jgi:hypothetical protein
MTGSQPTDLSDPRSVADAQLRPDAEKWKEAISAELATCTEYGVWEECDLPSGDQALLSHFVFERKQMGDARLDW